MLALTSHALDHVAGDTPACAAHAKAVLALQSPAHAPRQQGRGAEIVIFIMTMPSGDTAITGRCAYIEDARPTWPLRRPPSVCMECLCIH
jgi:hypothetical protein